MSKNLHIACSPLTGTIFAGKVLKKCVWAQGKQDLTIEALFAVAEHVTHFGKPVELSDTSGKLLFKIFVDRPAEKQFMTQKSEPSATEPMESIAQYVESLENPEDARAIRLMAAENDALRARVEELENIVRAIRDHDVEQTAQAILSKGAMQDFLLPLATRERIASIIEAKDE